MNFNTNSVIELISVIHSSFASKSESKRFCEAFQENNYKIDYTLEYYPFIPYIMNSVPPLLLQRLFLQQHAANCRSCRQEADWKFMALQKITPTKMFTPL